MLRRQALASKGTEPVLWFSTAGAAVHSVESRALQSFVGTAVGRGTAGLMRCCITLTWDGSLVGAFCSEMSDLRYFFQPSVPPNKHIMQMYWTTSTASTASNRGRGIYPESQ